MERKPISVGLVSLGCAKNTVDLQVMAGHLLKAGCVLAPQPDDADVILVNTCAFIEAVRAEAVEEILRACELKKTGRCRAVVVSGCFAQRYGERLTATFPDVDAFLGVDALDKIAGIVRRAVGGEKTKVIVPPGMPEKLFAPPVPALRLTGAAFAYLKIAEGCAHRCSYCAIPAIRGQYRSRPLRSILAEARALLATGVKELNVIAQDPLLYGVDFADGTNVVTLLRALDKLKGDFWLRVLYAYPSEITDEFLDWMNASPHAVKYVDVPIQHTDPQILKAMARGSAAKATLAAAGRLRAAVPGVTLRTTVLTGFPGETKDSFAKLLMDVKRMKFDHLGAFAFSPEEGTVAAELDGCPPPAEAVKRARAVMSAQRKVWAEKAKGHLGKTFRALVVAPGVARLESQAPDVDGVVRFTGKAEIGAFAKVRIEKVDGFDFEATILAQGEKA
ncbi:MAG: 30S ribosomal protein S12 methylthiotransferase RimO [Kiritimatiellae bacterium]|nr:30S ribosomal protein S12 methylthiotransferase RimO [Kiritimatiellia bacterium]